MLKDFNYMKELIKSSPTTYKKPKDFNGNLSKSECIRLLNLLNKVSCKGMHFHNKIAISIVIHMSIKYKERFSISIGDTLYIDYLNNNHLQILNREDILNAIFADILTLSPMYPDIFPENDMRNIITYYLNNTYGDLELRNLVNLVYILGKYNVKMPVEVFKKIILKEKWDKYNKESRDAIIRVLFTNFYNQYEDENIIHEILCAIIKSAFFDMNGDEYDTIYVDTDQNRLVLLLSLIEQQIIFYPEQLYHMCMAFFTKHTSSDTESKLLELGKSCFKIINNQKS